MRTTILVVTLGLGLPGCNPAADQGRVGREAPPAAAVLAPDPDVRLLDKLRMVENEIDLALAGDAARVLTAEAISDQLLHAPRDMDWLVTGYLVEARLRQIQARADAIVALMRRGASLAAAEPDLLTLRADVQDLQRQLRLPGGGDAPPTLETLLAQDPLRDAQVRVTVPGGSPGPQPLGRPLGQPVN